MEKFKIREAKIVIFFILGRILDADVLKERIKISIFEIAE